MTVTTNEYGQQNMFAKEPVMYYENYGMLTPNMVKERRYWQTVFWHFLT